MLLATHFGLVVVLLEMLGERPGHGVYPIVVRLQSLPLELLPMLWPIMCDFVIL